MPLTMTFSVSSYIFIVNPYANRGPLYNRHKSAAINPAPAGKYHKESMCLAIAVKISSGWPLPSMRRYLPRSS